jgi:hypothetical protein
MTSWLFRGRLCDALPCRWLYSITIINIGKPWNLSSRMKWPVITQRCIGSFSVMFIIEQNFILWYKYMQKHMWNLSIWTFISAFFGLYVRCCVIIWRSRNEEKWCQHFLCPEVDSIVSYVLCRLQNRPQNSQATASHVGSKFSRWSKWRLSVQFGTKTAFAVRSVTSSSRECVHNGHEIVFKYVCINISC